MSSDGNKSNCDITARQPESHGLTASLRQSAAKWHETARYAVCASPPYFVDLPSKHIARWQTHQEAKLITERLSQTFKTKTRDSEFEGVFFSLDLEMPISYPEREGKASVGDLLLMQITQPTEVSRVCTQLWSPKLVESVSHGRVRTYKDNAGSHSNLPANAVIIPASQFEMRKVYRSLIEHAGERTMYEGGFSTVKHCLHLLRPHMHIEPASILSDAEIREALIPFRDQSQRILGQPLVQCG